MSDCLHIMQLCSSVCAVLTQVVLRRGIAPNRRALVSLCREEGGQSMATEKPFVNSLVERIVRAVEPAVIGQEQPTPVGSSCLALC